MVVEVVSLHNHFKFLCNERGLFFDVGEDLVAPYEVAGAEEVKAVVGEVLAEIAIGVSEVGVEINPGDALALGHGLEPGIDVADDLLFAGHVFVAVKGVVDG